MRVFDVDQRRFKADDLETIVWRDRTEGVMIDAGRLYCVPIDFDDTHEYECEVTFKRADYNVYDTPRTVRLSFRPDEEDYNPLQELTLQKRTKVTIVGSFGDQAKLDFMIFTRPRCF